MKEIVIKLSDSEYNQLIYGDDGLDYEVLEQAVVNGTILEPHGRLADLDAALKCVDDDSLEPCDAKWQAIGLFDWAMSKRVVLEARRNENDA
jgi:hypothetical protein